MVQVMPDIQFMFNGQCFPRYRYQPGTASSASPASAPPGLSPSSSQTGCRTSTSSPSGSASRAGSIPNLREQQKGLPGGETAQGGFFDDADPSAQGDLIEPGLPPTTERIDNITDAALARFQAHYRDASITGARADPITKDDIFDYVYGVLHAPAYRERFANDLAKELPRIPFAPDFRAFAAAGRALAALHLGYETCAEYPLRTEFPLLSATTPRTPEPPPEKYRLGTKKMRLADDGKTLVINDHVRLTGIPPEAHAYEVNGRTPIGWFIDRYVVKQDTQSGIVNDPNGWFDDPRDLVAAIRRIVHISVETLAIVDKLPSPFDPPN